MGILDRLRGNPQKQAQLEQIGMQAKHDLALAESHPAANVQTNDEMLSQLQQSYYLQIDDMTLQQYMSDPQLKYLQPAFSHLNRTSKIPETKTLHNLAAMARLDIEYILLLHELNMPEDEMELVGWAKLEALRIFGLSSVNDQIDGYRGKLVTEKIKTIKVELAGQKKKGLF